MDSLEDIVARALELEKGLRGEFLLSLPLDVREAVQARLDAAPRTDLTQLSPRKPRGSAVADTAADHPTQIDRYRVLREIGRGGMGQVFLAEQTEPIKRSVALKVIKTTTPTEDVLARFEAERQALAMMEHENIAKVLDAGCTEDGRPYFVMELVDGVPITQHCDSSQLSPRERLKLFVQTCNAIQHAHQKGILHRDIKPSNVLVTERDGQSVVKVIDFGLAKAVHETTELTDRSLLTVEGQVIGTLAYMSPEQACLGGLDIDTRTDVYSLGVVLYELLTGSTPLTRERIRGESIVRILSLIRDEEAPRPSQRLNDSGEAASEISDQRKIQTSQLSLILKGDLDWIAVKALEKDRSRRYETAAALADDVQRYLEGDPIAARPPSVKYRLGKTIKKNRVVFTAAATALSLLIIGLITTGGMWLRANRAEELATAEADNARRATQKEMRARVDVEKQRDRARDAETDALEKQDMAEAAVARANHSLALARWDAHRAREADEFLDKVPPERRRLEWRLAKRQVRGSDFTCYGHTSHVLSVRFSPDGKVIASGSDDGTIRLWDSATGESLRVLNAHETSVLSLSFSPDGSRIASGSGDYSNPGEIKIWDLKTGQSLKTLRGHERGVTSVCFSPDGKQLASGASDYKIRIWDAESGNSTAELIGHTNRVTSLTFSPDGKHIASGGSDSLVKVWEVSSGDEVQSFAGHTLRILRVRFSPDGNQIASASDDQTVRLWDVASGQAVQSLKGHTSGVTSLAYSPDGLWIAASGNDATIRLWDVATGQSMSVLRGHKSDIWSIGFSPDGARIVSGGRDNTVRVWDAASRETVRIPGSNRSPVWALGVSRDSRQLASAGNDGNIRLWDLDSGKNVQTLVGHTEAIWGLSFDPSGRRVVSAGTDETIRLWDTVLGTEIAVLRGHKGAVRAVAFSPDGKQIASGGWDRTVRLWDAATGKELTTLKGHKREVQHLMFNPDGSLILTASADHTVKLWDVRAGALGKTLTGHNHSVYSACFSPNGEQVVSGSEDRTVRIWDVDSGEQVQVLTGHSSRISSVCFSPDGSRIISGGRDKSIRVWSQATGEEMWVIPGQTAVHCLLACADGRTIVSAGRDHLIRLWDAGVGQEVRTLRGHTGYVNDIRLSADGARLYSQASGEQFVWDTANATRLPHAVWDPPADPALTQVNQFLAVPSGDEIVLVDLRFKARAIEKQHRVFKARIRAWWHREEVLRAETLQNWYAMTFHGALFLKAQPRSQEARESLQRAYAKLTEEEKKVLPAIVVESLVLLGLRR